MKRYDQWHHLTLLGDKQLALRYLAEGRKYLGWVAADLAVSGNQQGLLRRRNPDGVLFTARIAGEIPELTIDARGVAPQRQPLQLGGFVTWPTDGAGADALADTQRIVLAGEQYRGIREPTYSRTFDEGLNRAGNVDWHGKGGWVLSWYGPRTRYLDSIVELQPYVFFKGRELVDARDYIDIDAVVLGAAITKIDGVPWLVVVSEEFQFGRWEDVWMVQVTGSALDAEISVVPETFVYLNNRNHNDNTLFNHPWLFNPEGTQARRMVVVNSESAIVERVIDLLPDDTEPFLTVAYSDSPFPPAARPEYRGYQAYTYGFYGGTGTVVRRHPVDVSGLFPDTGPPDTTVHIGASMDTESGDSTYQASPIGLIDFTHTEAVEFEDDPWQPIAVDFKPDGSVVYAYGRASSRTTTTTGGFTLESAPDLAVDYLTDDIDCETTYDSGGNKIAGSASFSSDKVIGFGTIALTIPSHLEETSVAVDFGIRVGALEVVFESGSTREATATGTQTITPDPAPIDRFEWGADLANLTGEQFPEFILGLSANAATNTMTASREDLRTETELVPLLAYMDLRNDTLFVVEGRKDTTTTITRELAYDLIAKAGGSHTDRTITQTLITWRTRGWVAGVLRLDTTATEQDSLEDTGAVVSAQPTLVADPFLYDSSYFHRPPWLGPDLGTGTIEDQAGPWVNTIRPSAWGFILTTGDIAPVPTQPDWPDSVVASPVTGDLDPSSLYQLDTTEYPIAQDFTQTTLIAFDYDDDGLGGFDAGAETMRMTWHVDADGFPHLGGWAQYKNRWVFSLPLPTPADDPQLYVSLCGAGEVAARALTDDDPPVSHFFPIWVLSNTTGLILE